MHIFKLKKQHMMGHIDMKIKSQYWGNLGKTVYIVKGK